MVLLEVHTDCQTSAKVAIECPESHEGLQGKGRRKNKHSVCVCVWLPLGREVAKDFFFVGPISLLARLYIALLYTLMDLHFSW